MEEVEVVVVTRKECSRQISPGFRSLVISLTCLGELDSVSQLHLIVVTSIVLSILTTTSITTVKMLLPSVAALAGIAATANAFLIPSTLSIPNALTLDLASLAPGATKIDLACNDCFFDAPKPLTNSTLPITFSLNSARNNLEINSIPLLMTENILGGAGVLNTQERFSLPLIQNPKFPKLRPFESVLYRKTEVDFYTERRTIEAADGAEGELIVMNFFITQVNGKPVSQVESATIRMLRDEEGLLSIVDVVRVSPDNKMSSDVDTQPKTISSTRPRPSSVQPCGSGVLGVWCSIRSALFTSHNVHIPGTERLPGLRCSQSAKAKIESMLDSRPAPPRVPIRGGPAKFWHPLPGDGPVHVDHNDGDDFHALPFMTHATPQDDPEGLQQDIPVWWKQHGEHPHHHHGHHHGGPFGFGHWSGEHGSSTSEEHSGNFFVDVLLPMMIGMAAGLTVSCVGCVIGMGVVALWKAMFARGGEEEEDSEEGEKSALLDEEAALQGAEEEALPLYREMESEYEFVDRIA